MTRRFCKISNDRDRRDEPAGSRVWSASLDCFYGNTMAIFSQTHARVLASMHSQVVIQEQNERQFYSPG